MANLTIEKLTDGQILPDNIAKTDSEATITKQWNFNKVPQILDDQGNVTSLVTQKDIAEIKTKLDAIPDFVGLTQEDFATIENPDDKTVYLERKS